MCVSVCVWLWWWWCCVCVCFCLGGGGGGVEGAVGGGALAGVRHHLQHAPLLEATAARSPWTLPFHHLTGFLLPLGSVDVMCLAGYCRGGIDDDILRAVLDLTRGRPFLLCADFNDPPEALARTEWRALWGAAILAPQSPPATRRKRAASSTTC